MSIFWWYIAWTGLNAAWVIGFALLEGYAFQTRGLTLSMYVYDLSLYFGPFPFLLGIVVGGLAVHFWWHWLPPGARNVG